MTPLLVRFRRSYGASPLQLLLVVAAFLLAAYTIHVVGLVALWDPDVWWQSIAVWFVGAAVAHDLVLFPAYAAVDRVLTAAGGHGRRARGRGRGRARPAVPVLNYVRVPLLACGLVTPMFFPGVIRQGADTYVRATGQTQDPFLMRWAVLCLVFLLLGLAAYVVARVAAARRPVPAPLAPAAPGPSVPSPSPGSAPEATVAVAAAWALLASLALVGLRAVDRRRRRP